MISNKFAPKHQAFNRKRAPTYVHRPAPLTLMQALLSGLPFREYVSSSSGAYLYRDGKLIFSDHISLLFGDVTLLRVDNNLRFSAAEIIGGVYYNIFADEIDNPHFTQAYGLHLCIDEHEAQVAIAKFRREMEYAERLGRRK